MASGLQDIPLRRIPKQWDPQWFADFVRDVLRLADARNMRVGPEIDLSGQSDDVATLSMALGSIDLDKIEDQPGLSVIGNPTDATGVLQALVSNTDLQVLRRLGLGVGFGLINSTFISDFSEASQDATAALIDDSTNITWVYDDAMDSLVGTVSLADPTASVGLTPVIGIAATVMRSDAAPALDVGIIPTWTAAHTFNLTPVVPNDSWTYAKIQNVSATSRVLGRISALAGDIEELTGANLATIIGTALGANPSASVGLTAVNGALGTYLRSDAAPALSQSIAPTWTAAHTYTQSVTAGTTYPITLSAGTPGMLWLESDQIADERRCHIILTAKSWRYQLVSDDGVTTAAVLNVSRGTAVVVSSIDFGNATNNPTYGFLGTGTATFSGQVSALRFVPTSATVPTNGLYLPGANNPGLAANTTKVLDWTSAVVNVTANLSLTTAGNKLLVKEGSNAAMGASTLVAGTVTVSNTLVTANSRIFLTGQNSSGTHGELTISARVVGTSFTITSSILTDTRSIAWLIVEPAP